MDGKNSFGRRISLLNENEEIPNVRLPSIPLSLRSRTSSYASSSIGSPQTPQLVRSDSTDSRAMQTPSPITPDFSFEGLPPSQNMASPVFSSRSTFLSSKKEPHSAYPPVPQSSGPLPYHTAGASQAAYFRPQPTENRTMSPANPRSKKNSYPCPMAKQYNCTDYFTTSGHAARHAKKHTGKKDAFCPECNKAFTRKDNMEQHRRTHQSGRNAIKGGDDRSKKAKQQIKRPRPAPLQSSSMSITSMSIMDPNLSLSPASSFGMAPAVQPIDSYSQEYSHRSPYPDPPQFAASQFHLAGSAYGLDALAIAASGEKRKFET
ncbi:hypothetical protein K432DRAFT_388178 [Lepidopterella palustris CBS 459.81]|uniref:C2H2-type domain-containing protein n=1 Tax=Lepidopterella palustris CBS 459.81 TaxID=1314670 RepID=A0A8E2ELE3_9PEZI|nr:hypothetical protein K432DRAFT_388178 [Lepidopterella palustris CBS 459.81]